MTRDVFRKLVADHARAWGKVGQSDPRLVVNPFHQEYLKDAIAVSQQLFDAYEVLVDTDDF